MLIKSGYNPKESYNVSPIETTGELLEFVKGHSVVTVIDLEGQLRNVKITSVKTWKRKPTDCTIKWKYGLYTYGETVFINNSFSHGLKIVKGI